MDFVVVTTAVVSAMSNVKRFLLAMECVSSHVRVQAHRACAGAEKSSPPTAGSTLELYISAFLARTFFGMSVSILKFHSRS